MPRPPSGCRVWFEIDLDAIAHNFSEIRRLVGSSVRIYPALKRNAYGCGAGPVARLLEEVGADGLAVGDIDEGIAVRAAGVKLPVFLYASVQTGLLSELRAHDLMPTVSSAEEVDAYEAGLQSGPPLSVFVKVDVGPLRAGVMPAEAFALISRVAASPKLRLAGVYAHMFLGTDFAGEGAELQFVQMTTILGKLDEAGIDVPIRMVGSSDIILMFPHMYLNAVDPGRMLYGIGKETAVSGPLRLRPALGAIKAQLILKKQVSAADLETLSTPFPARAGMTIGLLAVGWGDCLPRRMSGGVALIRGRRVPIVGPVHVEHARIDLTDCPEAEAGDEVVLAGVQGAETIDVAEIASAWSAGMNEFICGLREHVPRFYIRNGRLTYGDGVLVGERNSAAGGSPA